MMGGGGGGVTGRPFRMKDAVNLVDRFMGIGWGESGKVAGGEDEVGRRSGGGVAVVRAGAGNGGVGVQDPSMHPGTAAPPRVAGSIFMLPAAPAAEAPVSLSVRFRVRGLGLLEVCVGG